MISDLRQPEAVFFDWDGTLVDSFGLLHAAHNHTRAELGFDSFSIEEFEGYFGQPREILYAKLYPDKMDEAKKHFEAYVLNNHIDGLKPMSGAGVLLELLYKMQIPCGVVSNKKRTLIEAEIASYGWEKCFVSVVGAGEASVDKPSSEPLKLAVSRSGLNVGMENIWFVGDTDNDVLCSDAAGSVTVLIASKNQAKPLLEKYKIHLHCNNCSELYEFLLQYEGKPLKKVIKTI